MTEVLKIVVCADLHWGSPRIDSGLLYARLKKTLIPELRDAQLIFIAGDMYDQLLTVNSKAHKYATMFISDLLRISAGTGIQVRLLHGTFTHDRDQLSVFEHHRVPHARFKVINQIECEELTDIRNGDTVIPYNLRVGYIPDNLPYRKSTDAVEQLKRCITILGWDHLDMVVGHGSFEHVIDPHSGHKPPCLFSWDQFTKIVPEGPIAMGHIHTHGRKRNVYYCGSFDRLAHGEEEKKGFYTFTKDVFHGWKSKFVVNEEATPFISIYPEGRDAPEITQNFVEQIEAKFPDRRGYVRVLHESPEIRSLLHKVCAQQFPELTYSSKSLGDTDNTSIRVDEITLDIFDDVKPDVNNLGELVYQFLEEHNATDDIPKDVIVEKTKQLINPTW